MFNTSEVCSIRLCGLQSQQKKLSIDSVAYLGIVYVRMDYTEQLAGLARAENPKYYGKYGEKMTVTQLGLICVRWIKGNQRPFLF